MKTERLEKPLAKLIENLHIDIDSYEVTSRDESKFNQDVERAVIFCAKSLKNSFKCSPEFVETALYEADYFEENGDYTESDVKELCEVIDGFGVEMMNASSNRIVEKQIWFDMNH